MMTEKALAPYQDTTAQLARKKIYAGVPDDDVQLALAICQKYDLDPLLRHVVLIKGRAKDQQGNWTDRYNVYITRDGLLHAAHQSGVPFSVEFEQPIKAENPYTDAPDIYLQGTLFRDGHPSFKGGLWFSEYVQTGKSGGVIGAWKTHPAAMHQKVVEVYLLRRGFDVSLTPLEEIQSTFKGEIIEAETRKAGASGTSTNGNGASRPLSPDKLREFLHQKAGDDPTPISEAQIPLVARKFAECFAPAKDAEDRYHKSLNWLWGMADLIVDSATKLTLARAQSTLDWLLDPAGPDASGDTPLHEHAKDEAQRVYKAVLAEQGQKELPL